ncbi:hypothetical protein THERMOS_18 [Bathymodiolus thermophilus thioautotrophic gill symbiont]|uniref:Uncharacterized protein n=1 Tax=Bathymodiolus thermophilus thioautotrophic gill symbiont TaxID=2360 RepID=A0A8H8XBQ9_9GAMM|nr:hypothetical protein THERMOS_18 [Bathymodiolus thermophilus thioautotrophic gill symbiont]
MGLKNYRVGEKWILDDYSYLCKGLNYKKNRACANKKYFLQKNILIQKNMLLSVFKKNLVEFFSPTTVELL